MWLWSQKRSSYLARCLVDEVDLSLEGSFTLTGADQETVDRGSEKKNKKKTHAYIHTNNDSGHSLYQFIYPSLRMLKMACLT